MRIGLLAAVERVSSCSWSGWGRLVGISLCGLGLVLSLAARAETWPLIENNNFTWTYSTWSYTGVDPQLACADFDSWVAPQLPPETPHYCQEYSDQAKTFRHTYSASPIYGNWNATCPSGYVPSMYSGGYCVTDQCSVSVGKQVEFRNYTTGSTSCSTSEYVCSGGCRARVIKSDCTGFTMADGAMAAIRGGGAEVLAAPCQTGDQEVSQMSTQPQGEPIIQGGGYGIVEMANDVSSTNIARIATNTARIANAVEGGGLPGGGGSTCGGPSQPPCEVNSAVDEGDTATTKGTMDTAIGASKSGMEATVQAQADALSSAPSFLPGGSQWLPSFTSIFPAAACHYVQAVQLPIASFNVDVSVCSWGGYARDILGLVAYFSALIFVFWTIFGRNN